MYSDRSPRVVSDGRNERCNGPAMEELPRPRLMFVSSSDWGDLVAKGVGQMIRERREGGYFDLVVSIHPWAKRTQTVRFDANQRLEEFGHDRFPMASRSRMLRRALAPLLVLDSVRRMRSIIHREGITLARASDPYWTALVTYLATLRTPAIFVISIHADWTNRRQLDPKSVPRLLGSFRLAQIMSRALFRRAAAVIVVRESLADEVLASGIPSERVFLLPHVVGDDFFVDGPPREPKAGALGPYVVFAGRISRENYVYDLLEAMRRLPAECPVNLLVAGLGPEEPALKSQVASDPRLCKKVQFLGSIPRQELRDLRSRALANICLMGGYSLIESCASGRPVIAYDTEWHGELIRTGESGILLPVGDTAAIAASIEFLRRSPDDASRLGAAARDLAYERHSSAAVLPRRHQVFDQIGDLERRS